MLTNKRIKLYYGGVRETNKAVPYELRFKNFAGLNLVIKSNSKIFLKMIDREYKLFTHPGIIAYYKNKFKNLSNVCVEIVFENEDNRILSVGHAGLEREIKRFLFDRFIILHASSVRYNGFNLFFIGDIKSGKSTMCSAMFDHGAAVLGEDYSIIRKDTGKALLFPTFIGNIRNGARSAIQEEYLGRFDKNNNTPLIQRMIDMTIEDYKILMEYHKRLYGLNNGLLKGGLKKKKNAFILLKKNWKRSNGKILVPAKPLEILPELMRNLAANRNYSGREMKDSMPLFLKSECYVLRRAPLDLMVSEICSRFR